MSKHNRHPYHLHPICNGWAMAFKRNIYRETQYRYFTTPQQQLKLRIWISETLCLWTKKNGKQEIRIWLVYKPKTIILKK